MSTIRKCRMCGGDYTPVGRWDDPNICRDCIRLGNEIERQSLSVPEAQMVVSEIDQAAGALAGCYKHLPPEAQASAIRES